MWWRIQITYWLIKIEKRSVSSAWKYSAEFMECKGYWTAKVCVKTNYEIGEY